MGKLVSPKEMHEFLMSLPPEELKRQSTEVKRYLQKRIKEDNNEKRFKAKD